MDQSLLTFVSIFGSCLLIYILSIALGAGHDSDGDFHGDTHVELSDHSEISDIDGTGSSHGPSILSFRTLLLFGTGFGAVGAILDSLGFGVVISSIGGFLFGLVLGMVGWWVFKLAYSQQSNTNTSLQSLVARRGHVVIAIPSDGGMGQILTSNRYGDSTYVYAKSNNGAGISEGEEVLISNVVGDIVIVQKSTRPENLDQFQVNP